ncbi:MAG TPA: porin family protein [Burkholderiales bacterium]|nr:porin family protein [Burkholderiales bacterium]
MQIRKIISLTGLLGALILAPVASTYAATAEPGFYLGGSWGAYKVDEGDLDDNDDMLKGFVGAQFNSWFGVEGQWNDFNRLNNGGDEFEADGWGLSALFTLPMSDTSSLFAKIGNFWWDSESSFAGSARDPDGDDVFYGAGFKIGFNRHFAVRLEWERFDIADIDVDAFTAGIQYTF